jgi:hypothetical protein
MPAANLHEGDLRERQFPAENGEICNADVEPGHQTRVQPASAAVGQRMHNRVRRLSLKMVKRNICHRGFSFAVSHAVIIICALALTGAAAQAQSQQQSNPPQSGEGSQPSGPSQPNGQPTSKELPDAPGEMKNDAGAGPVQEVEDRTKQTVNKTEDVAKEGLMKARDWESSRIAGIYVGKNRKLVPMTANQRWQIYLSQTLTTPEAYVKRMFGALIDQARGAPDWQGGIGGYGERWASREGQFITANSLAALGNAKLGYEVRYDRCKCDGVWPRTRHAILRNFLTYNRTEKQLRPQWALFGGAFGGGVVATTWKPSSQSYLKNGMWGVVGQAGYGALLNFVTEFAVEINRKQGVGR